MFFIITFVFPSHGVLLYDGIAPGMYNICKS